MGPARLPLMVGNAHPTCLICFYRKLETRNSL